MARPPTFLNVYKKLYATHGPQGWWPGDSAFEIMVGAVLTQNTAWTNVEKAIANLKLARALTPRKILAASRGDLATWLKPSGYFNVKTKRLRAVCHWLVEQGGVKRLAKIPTPALRTALLSVHGVGPETADDILLYAFNRPVFVIDAYTRRFFSRLGLIEGKEPYEILRERFQSALQTDTRLFNEYHALIVLHAKDTCRTQPHCGRCGFVRTCGAAEIDRSTPALTQNRRRCG